MAVKHIPVPLSHWSSEIERGRQRTTDLRALARILLRSVSEAAVIEMLSKKASDWDWLTRLSEHDAQWQELTSILTDLGADYTRTQFTDAMGRACRFMYGPVVQQRAKSKSDVA